MKLREVNDPEMQLRAQVKELQGRVDQQDREIMELTIDIGTLKRTVAALIKKMGPRGNTS